MTTDPADYVEALAAIGVSEPDQLAELIEQFPDVFALAAYQQQSGVGDGAAATVEVLRFPAGGEPLDEFAESFGEGLEAGGELRDHRRERARRRYGSVHGCPDRLRQGVGRASRRAGGGSRTWSTAARCSGSWRSQPPARSTTPFRGHSIGALRPLPFRPRMTTRRVAMVSDDGAHPSRPPVAMVGTSWRGEPVIAERRVLIRVANRASVPPVPASVWQTLTPRPSERPQHLSGLAGPRRTGDDRGGHGWLHGCKSGRGSRGICGRRISLPADPAPPRQITAFGVTAWTAHAAGDP